MFDKDFLKKFSAMGEYVNLLAFKDTEEYRVVRGHILIERELDKLLGRKLKNFANLQKHHRLYFSLKTELALSLGIISKKLADALQALNKIRNRMSHENIQDISLNEIKKLNTKFFKQPMFQKALEFTYEKGFKDALMLSTLLLFWEIKRLEDPKVEKIV